MESFSGVHATSRKVAGLIPDEAVGIFIYLILSATLRSWGWFILEQKWVPGLPPEGKERPKLGSDKLANF